ncbi:MULTISPECIES: hypothetical protein [Acinetobacter]|uniref:Uncharacterized protein n=1 Tax=Acinetobacter baylyi (strain ATCC 33305 / BD413 / ADP1) TaxID=62977 RepID=Q6FDM0_ACIAD|nr:MULTISPECIES: hypothetical protein [Acinetobacter]UXJ57029.1 phosphoglycerate kinase [Acinetobacter baylyi]UXJ61472.1 phosphoglycerate kinase [Acinetobacter baylyi]CAG67838.1 hypothetical protein; putative phosphoglycerate kinase [Acinetobacter baylyi ADP1]
MTKATMGQGTVKNSAELTNRDINNTQEITRDQTTGMLNGSVTVDHRLLSESGRAEIVKEQKELPENGVQIAKNIVSQLPEGQYKTDALNTLSHLQVKAAVTPVGFKEVGDELLNQYVKFIEQCNDPKIFRAMADQPETLKLLQEAYTLEKELNQYKQQLISQGLDEEDANAEIRQRLLERRNQPNLNQTTTTQSTVTTQAEISSSTSDDISRINVGTLETQEVQASIFALPNAKTDMAKLGGEDISVVNDSNLAIDVLTRIGQLKQNFDAVVDSTGVDKEKASLVVNMLLGGVAGTVKTLVEDKLIGNQVAAIQDRLTKEGVALVHGTDYDTVQQASQRDQLGNDTAKQLSDQLELTGEGINLSSGIIGGTINLGSKGTTTKTIDGKEVEVSTNGEVLGGAHKDTSKPVNDGFDSHHCPAKNCYKDAPISSSDGPAIKMEPADHRETASYGNSDAAKKYREKQQELLNQGRLQEAVDMDIHDIRSKFGDKYDQHILEMQKYIDTLDPNIFIKK